VIEFVASLTSKEGIKHISMLAGGFEQCHNFIETINLI
jgi:hypothetical protein